MASFASTLRDLLPAYLHETLDWDFLPWSFVKDHHDDLPGPVLTGLFDAYLRINSSIDLKVISSQVIPEEFWGCMRCGFCCSAMRPKAVKASTFKTWEEVDAPVAWFYKSRGRTRRNQVYRCWYNCGVRLRICPFMIINSNDLRPICAIYHMGDEYRPPVCSHYTPRHETCTGKNMEIDPWEKN